MSSPCPDCGWPKSTADCMVNNCPSHDKAEPPAQGVENTRKEARECFICRQTYTGLFCPKCGVYSKPKVREGDTSDPALEVGIWRGRYDALRAKVAELEAAVDGKTAMEWKVMANRLAAKLRALAKPHPTKGEVEEAFAAGFEAAARDKTLPNPWEYGDAWDVFLRAKRKQFDQGAKWLGPRLPDLPNHLLDAEAAPEGGAGG